MALTKINASVIANNTIAVGNIADNSVDATKIASNSILTRHIDDDQITGDQLADALTVVTSVTVPTVTVGDGHTMGDDGDDNFVLTGSAGENVIIDSAVNIILDADVGEVQFKDAGTEIGAVSMLNQNINIESKVADKDIVFKGIDGSSDLTAMTIDMSEGGRVGIGLTAPDGQLHVKGSTNNTIKSDFTVADGTATYTLHAYARNGTNKWRLGSKADDSYLSWYNDATSTHQLALKSDGNVGIGTTSPVGKLDVSVASNQRIRLDDFGGTSRISSRNDSATILALKIDASDLILNSGSGGNVGVGTATPQSLFQVAQPNGTMSHFGGSAVTNTHFSGISLGYTEAGNTNYRKAAIVQEQIGDGAARGHMHLLVDTANDGNSAVLADAKLSIHGTSGNVGIGDSNPQHPFKVHLTNGEIAMFGSNGMNSPGNYAGIGLGQVLANGTTYQKVSLVTEGRNSGSYVQDFHILVDTVADANSAVLSDAKLTIDGGYGAVSMPSQPCFSAALPAVTTTGNMIVFGGEHLDVGNHYNTSNGRFTAPIAGNYYFSFSLLIDPSGANHYSRVLFAVNGQTSTQWTDNLENASREAQGDYHSVAGAAIIPLSANDYVQLYNSGQSPTYGTAYGNFSGFLVS